ncbi:MAG: hemerythrin domain-containing protein [Elusimicrobia bacterium]|nr:hemerythrin domain-containing protein [Elusimicrobiota bacterium]
MESSATKILEEEHHAIEKVIACAAALADNPAEGPDQEVLGRIIRFMRDYVENCHHEKEERILFPLLVRKGVPVTGCPLGALTHEHESGRKLVAQLTLAADSPASAPRRRESLLEALRGLVALYPGHIWKENFLLFPMTDKLLSAEEQKSLLERFEAVEERIGRENHHRLEELADELRAATQSKEGQSRLDRDFIRPR